MLIFLNENSLLLYNLYYCKFKFKIDLTTLIYITSGLVLEENTYE